MGGDQRRVEIDHHRILGSRLVVGGMLTGQGPDRGAGLLPGSGDRLDGLVRVLGQGRDQARHGRVRRHRAVDPWFSAQGGEVTQRFTAEHQRHRQIADDLAWVVDRQRFPPPGQRLRQGPVQAGRADGFGQQDPASLPDRGHLRGIDMNPGIRAGTLHLEGAPSCWSMFL